MKLEKSLQPNCSELAIQFNNPSLTEVIESLRDCDMKVVLLYKDKEYPKLSSEVIATFVEAFQNASGGVPDKLRRFMALGTFPPELKEAYMKDKHEEDTPGIIVKYKRSTATLQIGDYCGGGEHVALQIGDCEQQDFPLFGKVEAKGLGEHYTVDGGHDENYTEWLAKRRK